MIAAGSRYATAVLVTAQDLDGNDILAITFTEPQDTVIQYSTYQVTGKDFIDLLAYTYYGDPTMWWYIANANPEIMDWSSLTSGSLIRIPLLGT